MLTFSGSRSRGSATLRWFRLGVMIRSFASALIAGEHDLRLLRAASNAWDAQMVWPYRRRQPTPFRTFPGMRLI